MMGFESECYWEGVIRKVGSYGFIKWELRDGLGFFIFVHDKSDLNNINVGDRMIGGLVFCFGRFTWGVLF